MCTGTASALLLTLCDLICPVLLLLASRQILTRALPAPVTRSLSVRRLCVRAGTPPVTCFTCFSQLQQQHETEGASPLAAVATTPSSCFLAHQVLKHERELIYSPFQPPESSPPSLPNGIGFSRGWGSCGSACYPHLGLGDLPSPKAPYL